MRSANQENRKLPIASANIQLAKLVDKKVSCIT